MDLEGSCFQISLQRSFSVGVGESPSQVTEVTGATVGCGRVEVDSEVY